MKKINDLFKNKRIDYELLLKYGFINENNKYIYKKSIMNNKFSIIFEISDDINSMIYDNTLNDEYLLFDVIDAKGSIVNNIKKEYDLVLLDILNNCCNPNVFKNKQSIEVIEYIKNKYLDELEFLWDKLPKAAIWRNKVNNKWYGLLMVIDKNKLGVKSNEMVECIILTYQKDNINNILNINGIYPGYHMNKKSWISIILDGTIDNNVLFNLIDNSYNLSIKKR